MSTGDQYTLFLRVTSEDELCLYMIEHPFAELPSPSAVADLFDAAKSMFASLYPDEEAVDFGVELRLVRPEDATIKS